ncbi:hypothetical protein [Ferrovibrio terrae]|uniref:hypothetical protein n=1 Tax=Ferrovibrio terrae TaxID=2594003 RepID=UPI0031384583
MAKQTAKQAGAQSGAANQQNQNAAEQGKAPDPSPISAQPQADVQPGAQRLQGVAPEGDNASAGTGHQFGIDPDPVSDAAPGPALNVDAAKTIAPQPEVAQPSVVNAVPTAFLVTGLKPKPGSAEVVELSIETPDGLMGGTLDMSIEAASANKIQQGKLVYVFEDGTYSVPDLPPMQVARPGAGPVTGLRGVNAQAAQPVEASTDLDVLDTTATISHPKREHTILVNGDEITHLFEHGKAKRMPASHAMKFVKHKAFIVTDPNTGKRYEPIADPSQRQVNIHALSPSQVIASLDELTNKALLNRCHTLNGGERYGGNSERNEMIAFIVAATSPQQAEGGGDEMDKTQLDRMFG